LQLRHAEVASLLLSRFTRAQIVEFSTKKWGVDYAQADKYIAAAKTLIQARIAEHKNYTIDDHLDGLFDQIRRARGAGDLRLEHDIFKDVARLGDLYPSEKHDVRSVSEQTVTHIYLPDNGRANDPAPPAGTARTISQ
jgi:hypothetical protein